MHDHSWRLIKIHFLWFDFSKLILQRPRYFPETIILFKVTNIVCFEICCRKNMPSNEYVKVKVIFKKERAWISRAVMVLILKTELSGDLRRIPLHNDFLTFDELHLMLCRVYGVDIGDDDKVKYRDADGDWITIADSNDLSLAIQVSTVLGRNIFLVHLPFIYFFNS